MARPRRCATIMSACLLLAGCAAGMGGVDAGWPKSLWAREMLVDLRYHQAFDEAPDLGFYDAAEVYRLWFEPPFSDWVMVRIYKEGEAYAMVSRRIPLEALQAVKRCIENAAQPETCAAAVPAAVTSRKLTQPEAQRFLELFRNYGFWDAPEQIDCHDSFDGNRFRLEALQDTPGTASRQRQLERGSPGPGAFRDLALYMLQTAGSLREPLDYPSDEAPGCDAGR